MKNTNKQLHSFIFGIFAVAMAFASSSIAFASEITPAKVVELVNKERLENNVLALIVNDRLTQAAEAKADDMVKNQYFAHTSPASVTPWHWIEQSGYGYKYAGENLAIHFSDAESQERAWMESVKHRENILNPKYQETGVAMRTFNQDGHQTIITVQMFGASSGAVLASQSEGLRDKSDTALSIEKSVSEAFTVENIRSGVWVFALMVVITMNIIGYVSLADGISTLYSGIIRKWQETHIQKI